MKKEDVQIVENIVKEVAEIQAPTDIDPINLNLNGEEVFPCLDKDAKEAVRCAEGLLEDVPITKDGYIHQRHKNKLSRAGFEAKESFDPDRPGSIYITATIPTTEDKAMSDNYGVHTITVERDISSYTY